MRHIWRGVLIEYLHAKEGVGCPMNIISWKVTTVLSQHLHIYVLCTLSMQHCGTHIVQCFAMQRCSAVFVCIYVWLCVSGVEHWLLLPGRGGLPSGGERGGSRAESQRFRRADVPHSSNSQSQGHRRDSHTVDEGWLSSGCNPTLHCAPHSTIHSMIPSFRVSVCLCVCVWGFRYLRQKEKTYIYLI